MKPARRRSEPRPVVTTLDRPLEPGEVDEIVEGLPDCLRHFEPADWPDPPGFAPAPGTNALGVEVDWNPSHRRRYRAQRRYLAALDDALGLDNAHGNRQRVYSTIAKASKT